jgi:hypothetical protein
VVGEGGWGGVDAWHSFTFQDMRMALRLNEMPLVEQSFGECGVLGWWDGWGVGVQGGCRVGLGGGDGGGGREGGLVACCIARL